jgi:hypothetical protein
LLRWQVMQERTKSWTAAHTPRTKKSVKRFLSAFMIVAMGIGRWHVHLVVDEDEVVQHAPVLPLRAVAHRLHQGAQVSRRRELLSQILKQLE